MTIHPNGIGGSLGDDLVTQSPLQTTGSIYYVDSGTGDDANAGTDRNAPKATLGSAVSSASTSGDIIVLLDGHTETITSAVTLSTGVVLVGEGRSAGKPTVKLTNNQSAASMILMGANTQIRNIWFEEEAQSNTSPTVDTNSADDVSIIGCYFECDSNTDAGLLIAFSNQVQVRNTTFISTATDDGSRPTYGIELSNGGSGLTLDGLVLDDGTVGFATAAFDASASQWTQVTGTGVSLLRGAKVLFEGTSTGWIIPSTVTGNAYISGLD